MWSVACVTAEMLTGSVLFQADSELGMVKKIDSELANTTDKRTLRRDSAVFRHDDAHRFVEALLNFPKMVPSAQAALSYKFVKI